MTERRRRNDDRADRAGVSGWTDQPPDDGAGVGGAGMSLPVAMELVKRWSGPESVAHVNVQSGRTRAVVAGDERKEPQ